MDNKKVVAGVAGTVIIGIVSYLSYRIIKDLNTIGDNINWENIDDSYNYRSPKSDQGS